MGVDRLTGEERFCLPSLLRRTPFTSPMQPAADALPQFCGGIIVSAAEKSASRMEQLGQLRPARRTPAEVRVDLFALVAGKSAQGVRAQHVAELVVANPVADVHDSPPTSATSLASQHPPMPCRLRHMYPSSRGRTSASRE